MDDKERDPRLEATPETDPNSEEVNEGDAVEAKRFETEANEEQAPDQAAFQTDSN